MSFIAPTEPAVDHELHNSEGPANLIASGSRTDRFADFIRGVALGDSLGMLAENLSRKTVAKLYRGQVEQKMPFGRGFLSDETEQVILTARAFGRKHSGLPLRISLRRELLAWLATLPIGAGTSTVKSGIKLAFASRHRIRFDCRIGVSSAGNGPLLRAATLGVLDDHPMFDVAVARTTLMTHDSLEALVCSIMTARIFSQALALTSADVPEAFREAARFTKTTLNVNHNDYGWYHEVSPMIESFDNYLNVIDLVSQGTISVAEGLERIGCGDGVGGHIVTTMFAALMIAAAHPEDVNAAADTAILAGGDTDSVAALACGLVAMTARSPQSFSRLKLWRDPFGLAAEPPASDEQLLRNIVHNRYLAGMALEHAALLWLAAIPFLTRRCIARWL